MALFAGLYALLLGQKGVLLLLDPNWVAKAMGAAMLVLPGFAIWAILIEIRFGLAAQKLSRLNQLPPLELELRPSGRATKESAEREFQRIKEAVGLDLGDWQLWFRLGEAHEAMGDRKLARKSIRKAISLFENADPSKP
jgi:tetratricopeptide (TPR) repeat protein